MSATFVVLPVVWAMAPFGGVPEKSNRLKLPLYRKYTEGILRRYMRLSLEAGRVPSLLGKEMFRGKVTSYRVHNFDDVVIFVHDVERCLGRLDEEQQHLVSRIALQQYTYLETAGLMGLTHRTVIRRYNQAVDRLTKVFLDSRMLEALDSCQVARRTP